VWTWFLAIASGGRISWEKCNQPIRTSLDIFIEDRFADWPSECPVAGLPSSIGNQLDRYFRPFYNWADALAIQRVGTAIPVCGECSSSDRCRRCRARLPKPAGNGLDLAGWDSDLENGMEPRMPGWLGFQRNCWERRTDDQVSRPDEKPTRRWRYGGLRATALVLLVWTSAGCSAGDGLNRQAISGAVTCDGHPLATGAILFEPATDGSGTAVGSTIRHGSFAVSRHDGPVPGRYRVRVYASSGTQALPTEGHGDRSPRPMLELLPETYNARTELVADVIASGSNHFRFDLGSRD
jgi:hypothetical protein